MLIIIPSLLPNGKICSLGMSKFLLDPGIQGSISPFADNISAKEIPYFLAIVIKVSSCIVV